MEQVTKCITCYKAVATCFVQIMHHGHDEVLMVCNNCKDRINEQEIANLTATGFISKHSDKGGKHETR